jgi:hypothetical protein
MLFVVPYCITTATGLTIHLQSNNNNNDNNNNNNKALKQNIVQNQDDTWNKSLLIVYQQF